MGAPSIERYAGDIHCSTAAVGGIAPTHDDRRTIVARNPLSRSDTSRVLCRLVLRHLFGVRTCPSHPYCNCSSSANTSWSLCGERCQDTMGSVATVNGVIFGRVDALFGSVENQKA